LLWYLWIILSLWWCLGGEYVRGEEGGACGVFGCEGCDI